MSECHDIYEAIDNPQAVVVETTGTQCHDAYADESARPTAAHTCRLASVRHGAVRVVRVLGRLDWATEADFRDLMRDHCDDQSVVVDLSAASLDAAGTGVVLAATARARRRSQHLAIVVSDPVEREVLVEAGLRDLVPVVATEKEAIDWFETHGALAADATSPTSV